MNKISIILLAFFSLLVSCNKDDFNNNTENVGISKITYYANFVMTGNELMVIAKGSTFTEPGISANAKGANVPVATTGAVNANKEGVYTLTYSAVNADGFAANAFRTVAVYATAADAAAQDLSGKYLRSSNGIIATWTKLAPGVYLVANAGGAVGADGLTVIAFNPSGYIISVPEQRSGDGSISSASGAVYTPGSPASYKWVFLNPTYGTAVRTFVKQ